MSSDTVFAFGLYRLIPAKRALLSDGHPVKLGGRALDMLQVLVERRDRVVGKTELLALVWPNLVVEENNLQVQVLALRKLLGHPAIATVPGRGYRFTLPVQIEGNAVAAPPVPAASPSSGELFGRDDDLRALQELLDEHGLVTLAGAAGIGKTRLAQGLVQKRLATDDPQRVCWVELAPLTDPTLIAGAVGRALGLAVDGIQDATGAVVSALRGRAALLVLDNAEHLLEGVAAFVTAVRAQSPSIKVLVTSQEVLRAVDEQVFRASPLALPDGGDLATANASGAVALFVARVRAVDQRFVLSRANAGAVVDICRRLDGIPLAIELAAARVPLLGVDGLHARLDERFKVLTAGARAALRRHQTLHAALNWSHGLLSAAEQVVYRRLGAFVGGFALEAAQHAVADEVIDPWDVLEHLGSLVDKSLVVAEGEGTPRYRMLETTRLFALERLADAGETAQQLRRHALAMVATLAPRAAGPRRWRVTRQEWEADAIEVDNVRAAIAWASENDDARVAIEVATGCALAYMRADLGNEFLARALPLHTRITDEIAPDLTGLYWLRLANAGTKSSSAAAWDASQRAVAILRSLDDSALLFEALTCAIWIGAGRTDVADLKPLVDEAATLERADWAPLFRSYHRWALYRLALRTGRHEEALQHARANLELSALSNPVLARRLEGESLVQCEIALGQFAPAEARARAVLLALAGSGLPDGRLGPIYEGLALALIMQDKHEAALPVAREARRRLSADDDDLRLLEPLALSAASRGNCGDAARIAGYVDAALRHRGIARWAAVAERRSRLDALLAAALAPAELANQLANGAMLTRDQAFALAFGDAA